MLYWCHRHGIYFADYRRHMVAEHDGRSDCVLQITAENAARILNGESRFDVCHTRTDRATSST